MSHWELKPKGSQTWVECLYEWSDRVGARIDWKFSVAHGSTQAWRAIAEIDGTPMHRFPGEGGSKDDAKNAVAFKLNQNRVLWRKK